MSAPLLPVEMYEDQRRRCHVVCVPDIFGTMSPVMNARGEPETILHEEAYAERSTSEWRDKVERIIASCRRVSPRAIGGKA